MKNPDDNPSNDTVIFPKKIVLFVKTFTIFGYDFCKKNHRFF